MKRAIFVFSAACVLTAMLTFLIQSDPVIVRAAAEGDPLSRVLGTAEEALGDMAFLRADSYLHGGLRPDILKALHEAGEARTEAEEKSFFDRFRAQNWTSAVYAQVNVTEHRHLEGPESKEMLPLLASAVEMDPHNIPAVLTTAFWLQDRFHDQEAALGILERGLRENPRSWEIEYQVGQLYFEFKKDPTAAIRHFRAALRNMERGEHLPFDPIRVRYALAEAYERQRDSSRALFFYREALGLYPAGQETALKETIQKKIKAMQNP